MSNHDKRLQALEARQQPAPIVNTAITDEMYNRTMETLAAALGDITGQPITPSQTEQAIKELHNDN